jgi:DNA-binding transcriptional regulator YiaG
LEVLQSLGGQTMTPTDFRAALDRLGLSQQAVARLWGLNPRTVRRWLAGDQDIPGWVRYALAGIGRNGKPKAF